MCHCCSVKDMCIASSADPDGSGFNRVSDQEGQVVTKNDKNSCFEELYLLSGGPSPRARKASIMVAIALSVKIL